MKMNRCCPIKKYDVSIFEKILVNLFFIFFTFQILSPYINGKTIYLEVFIMSLNPYFVLWLINGKIKKKLFIIIYLSFLLLGILNIGSCLKLFTTCILVIYFFYIWEKKLFYLEYYVIISVIFAVFQFIFLLINPSLAYIIGPENISKVMWGKYATPTYTNFYTIFFIPRVSGLSREAGFLASLICIVIFLLYIQRERENKRSSVILKIFLFIGYVLSFSKMSIIILFLILIEKFKNYINKIPYVLIVIIYVVFWIVFWSYNKEYLLDPKNITFLHRFGGYLTLTELNYKELLFGVNSIENIHSIYSYQCFISGFNFFAGFAGFIISRGLVFTIIWLLFLFLIGVTPSGILLLLLSTINVQLDTNQNFVVLSYFIVFKYYLNRRYISK